MEKITERTGLYHEHQEGALCGQHTLNNLLQGPMFSADTLADIARELDAEEKSVLTYTLDEFENMDDTGFLNIQVLQLALKMFDVELVPLASQQPIAKQARSRPEIIQAYICNFGLHWFAIRRFDRYYFNLNSFNYVPVLVLPRDLPYNFKYIEENGYSVFIVNGTLPNCLADQQLRSNPISLSEYELLTKDMPKLIMDGKVIGSSNDSYKNGNLVIHLPPELYREYQKNPNDPHIQQRVLARLPKDLVEQTSCDNPDCICQHRKKTIFVDRVPESRTLQQSSGHENYTRYGYKHDQPVMSHYLNDSFFEDLTFEEMTQTICQEPQIVTQPVIQILMSAPDSAVINVSAPHRNTSRRLVSMTQTSRTNRVSINDPDALQMNSPNLENKSEEKLLRETMARSLMDTSTKERKTCFRSEVDEMEQRMLDKAIAASLSTSGTKTALIEEPPEVIPVISIDSSPTSRMNYKPVTIEMPSSLTARAPPSTSTNSSSLTDTCSPSSNTSLSLPANTLLPPSTATKSSTPTLTRSESIKSPTVEGKSSKPKLRERRLTSYGNRHRSIISVQLNFDD